MKQESAKSRQVGGDHYMNMAIQPWTAMRSWMGDVAFEGFLRGNVIKYIARAGAKNGEEIQDLEKAAHYLDALLELKGGLDS
jgi:hypothetical protein